MSVVSIQPLTPAHIANVDDAEMDTVRALISVWEQKLVRNLTRSMYFDGKMPLKPTGNMPEESFSRIQAVLGWPEKAVTALAERLVFDGFVAPGQEEDPFELGSLLDANRFDLELPQAITSTLKHSCSFISTAMGDTQSAEPEVLVMARSAEWAAGLWDKRRRCPSGVLAITDVDASGAVVSMDVYLPHVVLMCSRLPSGRWVADRRANPLHEVLVEPLPYDPQLDRPFGRSRISRAVMNITDHALTTIVRTEIASDFYAAPRMMALGVSEDAFSHGKWQAAIDRWFAITRDEDGEVPEVKQFPQLTMQPLLEQYRLYASQFAGETGLPISALGIVQDNPPSAESLYAAEKELIVKARAATRVLGASLRNVARKVVMLRDGVDAPTSEILSIQANWLNPAFTSPVTSADALSKLSSVFPWLGESEVALEYAGFTAPEISRLLADKRRAQGSRVLEQIRAAADRVKNDDAAATSG